MRQRWQVSHYARCEPSLVPTHDDIVWAAGFFDGEGCVTWAYNRSGPKEYRCLQVTAVQKKLGPLNFLRERWGGSVGGKTRAGYWRACGFRAAAFLKQVLPYLQVKAEAAHEALWTLEQE